jgi:superfamily II DNA or RNA helicase
LEAAVRRRFNKKERQALYLAADGKSEMSGQPLGDDWHADHVKPWSLGGTTTMDNAQALTAAENIRKGASTIESVLTRSWQLKFLEKYRGHPSPDFLLAALPAAGKTRAALGVAREFLNAPERRLIIIGPTLNIQSQWKEQAQSIFGIQLLTERFSGHLDTPDFNGVVTTYQTVANNMLLFKRLCIKHRCMIVFDEIHHAGDYASWGRALREAFEPAQKRLMLSGTPFRSDGNPIPFLQLGADGAYQIDFAYDYPAALRDGVIREITFHRYAGSVTFKCEDQQQTFRTEDELQDDDAARRLRLLLSSPTYMGGLLQAAHDQLLEVRKTKPDAGGLVLCINADHAVRVQCLLREITGAEPDLIVSDGELATSTADTFRKDTSRMWAVAVRQVSEGVDIRRLMVLAYLTNWRTALFFRQAVGRIMRYEGTDADIEAYCFLPQDPDLAEHAKTIEQFQAQVLAEQDRDDFGDLDDEHPESERTTEQLTLLNAEAQFDGLTNRGQHHDATRSTQIIEFARKYQCSEANAARILFDFGITPAPTPAATPDNEALLIKLAKDCNSRTNQLAKARSCEPREIHGQWIKLTNAAHGKMTLMQFRQKLEWLEAQLREIGWI